MAGISASQPTYKIATLIYPGADILDFTGPVDLLSSTTYPSGAAIGQPVFQVKFIASTATVFTGGVMSINTDLNIEQARAKIEAYDVLIVPGAPPQIVIDMVTADSVEVQFIRDFVNLPQQPDGRKRVLLSVCTGGLLAAAAGALAGLQATTHHKSLDQLKQIDSSIQVVSSIEGRKPRYVDGGLTRAGSMRVITAGGVTCGMDAALFVAEICAGRAAAEQTAKMNEYHWQRA